MAVNKVTYNGNTLIDLTGDSVTPIKLGKGITAHDKSGATITGTADLLGYIETGNNIFLLGDLELGTYTVKYEKEDGSVVSIGELTIKPKFNNLAEPLPSNTTDTTKWVVNNRISSSGITSSSGSGTTVSNMIPCKNGDVIRIKGVSLRSGTDRIAIFGSTFSAWAAGYFNNGISLGSINAVVYNGLSNGVYTFTVTTDKTHTYTGIRFAMPTPTDASTVIITVNEEIT